MSREMVLVTRAELEDLRRKAVELDELKKQAAAEPALPSLGERFARFRARMKQEDRRNG